MSTCLKEIVASLLCNACKVLYWIVVLYIMYLSRRMLTFLHDLTKSLKSLSTDVFEQRTATGSRMFQVLENVYLQK